MPCIPDELWDVVVAPRTRTNGKLVLVLGALFRYGTKRPNEHNVLEMFWQGSVAELAKLSTLSDRAVFDAEKELEEMGVIRRHEGVRAGDAHAISAQCDFLDGPEFKPDPASKRVISNAVPVAGASLLLSRESANSAGYRVGDPANFAEYSQGVSANFADSRDNNLPLSSPDPANSAESLARAGNWWRGGGGGGEPDDHLIVRSGSGSTTTTIARDSANFADADMAIVKAAKALGHNRAPRLIKRFGPAQVALAIAYVEEQIELGSRGGSPILSPGALLEWVLTSGELEPVAAAAPSRTDTVELSATSTEREQWRCVLSAVREEIAGPAAATWLVDLEAAGWTADGRLVVQAPSAFVADGLGRFELTFLRAWHARFGQDLRELAFVAADGVLQR